MAQLEMLRQWASPEMDYSDVFPHFPLLFKWPKRSKKIQKGWQTFSECNINHWSFLGYPHLQVQTAPPGSSTQGSVRFGSGQRKLKRTLAVHCDTVWLKNGIMDLCRKFMFEMFVWFCLSASRNVDLFWDIPIWGGTHLTGIYIQ